MAENNAHSLYGSTNESSTIPDAAPHAGPVLDAEGCLVLATSFKASSSNPLAGIETQHLADALALWECHEGEWAQNSPLLLRFEECDLAASPAGPNGELALWKGAVDTSLKVKAVAGNSFEAKEQNDRLCLAWAAIPALAGAIGQKARSAHLECSTRLILDLEEVRIRIEALCGSIRIASENQPASSSSSR